MKSEREGINALAEPNCTGCVECLAVGGCIFADAPNAVTSAAATIHLISTRQNITQLLAIRLSRVSSRGSGGFTTIVQRNSSPVRISPLLIRIR
jgi:hypothetical protein